MLVLFDIDMTLLTTDGAGMKALGDAGRDRFGPGFDEKRTDYGGRLDPLIIHDLLVNNGIEPAAEHVAALRAGYRAHLQRRLASRPAKALAGAAELVDALAEEVGVTQGVLTGNFEETGRLKLGSAGIDRSEFVLNVWGDESPHASPARAHLPAVAIARYAEAKRAALAADRVLIIGDTVHDVSCALANGCRVLAVATGHATAGELEAAGAHRVEADLRETGRIVRWILD